MRLPAPPRRSGPEPLLPMIDVVFFLVVFFMIVSRLTNAEPFAVVRPAAPVTDSAEGEFALYLSASGETGFVGASGIVQGKAALAALAQARAAHCAVVDCTAQPPVLLLHADAAAPAQGLAALLPDLAAAGFAGVSLLTVLQ